MKKIALTFPIFLLSGCATTPSISVLGAFFPDWMFCILAGLVLMVVLRRILIAKHINATISRFAASVIYSAMTAMFSFIGWLVFFQN